MIRILCFMLLVGLAQINAEVSAEERNRVYVVGIDGLACPFCAYGIEKQIQKLEGVEQVEERARGINGEGGRRGEMMERWEVRGGRGWGGDVGQWREMRGEMDFFF